jgi:hypothetical protein
MDSIEKDIFPLGQKILLIHTGEFRESEGMNTKLRKKQYQ